MFKSILCFFILTACSSSPPPTPPPQPTPPPITQEVSLVTQPATVPVFNNSNPPKGTIGVTLWGSHEKLPSLPSNATSANGKLDIVIDGRSIPQDVAERNGLGTIVMGYTFKVPVQAVQYNYSYTLNVSRTLGIAQVVGYFNFHDKVNNTSLWYGQMAFDTRCGIAVGPMWDQGTNTAIFQVKAPNFACSPFSPRLVSFKVGPAEMANAVQMLRLKFPSLKLSPNMSDYELTHTNVNPEISGVTSRIDVGIQNWQISKQD